MAHCFGCGEELPEEFERCSKCGIDKHVLREIGSTHDRPKFLFGRVEESVNQTEEIEQVSQHPKTQRQRLDSTKQSEPRVDAPQNENRIQYRDLDLTNGLADDELPSIDIGEEGHFVPLHEEQATVGTSWMRHALAITFDMIVLGVLNFLILAVIGYQTARSYEILFVHSFFPLLLAHGAVSIILFSLFIHFFGHSPGMLVFKKLWSNR